MGMLAFRAVKGRVNLGLRFGCVQRGVNGKR
jgi:hypothetical protein